MRSQTRSNMIGAVVSMLVVAAGPLPAFALESHHFDVPVEPPSEALRDFASQADVHILVAADNVQIKQFAAVSGDFSIDAGLKILLTGTGLVPQYVGDHSIALVASTHSDVAGQRPPEIRNESMWDRFRVAAEDQTEVGGSSVRDAVSSENEKTESAQLEEVIVTAQKRAERLQDVPVPVSVIDARLITDSNQVLLRDYFTTVPGLSVTPNLLSAQIISLRGISTGDYTAPTVAVMVDGVAQSSSLPTTSAIVPDIDPGDLARIEVLRGPQGTLYGANSLGGLINYVTVDPSTAGLSGHIQGGISGVYHGSEPGYNVRGAVNIPISDTFATRFSGFERQDPGYINNPILGKNGVNEAHADGGRVAGLWRPAENFSLHFSALYQQTALDGKSEVVEGAGLGDLQQNYPKGVGSTQQSAGAYSAILRYKLGGIDLTSSTGYNINRFRDSWDGAAFYASTSEAGFNVPGSIIFDQDVTRKLTQEFRGAGSWRHLDWLAGLFYTHDRDTNFGSSWATLPATGQLVGVLSAETAPAPFIYSEYAAFTDLTYHFTERFDIQLGGRGGHEHTVFGASTNYGYLYGATAAYSAAAESTANAFTFLVAPRFKVSPDLMVYARIASGYRPGGPNFGGSVLDGAPPSYQPDRTYNYDIGVKGDFLDRRLAVDASLYYIDWRGIQLQLDTPHFYGYYDNGSKAKSEGLELDLTLKPLAGLTLTAWGTYDDAVLTQAFPSNSAVQGAPGDRLPITARFSGNFSLQQDFALWKSATGFVAGQVSYVGDRLGLFTAAPPRQNYPAYTKTDLRAGVKYDSWTATVYANNVANVRGVLNTVDFFPNEFVLITPRTIGLSVNRDF